MTISKELFVESIEAMRLQYVEDIKNAELVSEAFKIEQINLYDNQILNNMIMKMICSGTKDERECFIELEHYAYVMDFGKLSREEYFEEPEDLYDRLIKK
jgi:hypothetical protein